MPIALSGRRCINSSRPRNTRRSLRSATDVGSHLFKKTTRAGSIARFNVQFGCSQLRSRAHSLSWMRSVKFLQRFVAFSQRPQHFRCPKCRCGAKWRPLARWPVARKAAGLRPIDAGLRRPGRAKILPRAVRVPEYLPTKPEHSLAALQLFALRQAFPRLRATRLRGRLLFNNACNRTSATSGTPSAIGALASANFVGNVRMGELREQAHQAHQSYASFEAHVFFNDGRRYCPV